MSIFVGGDGLVVVCFLFCFGGLFLFLYERLKSDITHTHSASVSMCLNVIALNVEARTLSTTGN